MVKLSMDNLKQICSMGGVQVKIVADKKVRFYDKSYVVTGYEVRNKGDLVGTYCDIDGSAKVIYPRGSEYKHTSMYGQATTLESVMRSAARMALSNLDDSLRG